VEPDFLELNEIIEIHQDQIARYGGTPGIRDLGLLESACAMPQTQFGGSFLHDSIFSMAAAYLFHIAQNHPFVDGNKRTAIVAALVFLSMNGYKITATDDDIEAITLDIADGSVGKEMATEFFSTFAITIKDS
jgi:death on curing protein